MDGITRVIGTEQCPLVDNHPNTLAEAFVASEFRTPSSKRGLYFYKQEWWRWWMGRWEVIPASLVEDCVLEWFRDKWVEGEEGATRVRVWGQQLSHVMRSVEAVCRAHFKDDPVWLRKSTTEEVRDLEGVVAFQDVCVDVKETAKRGEWVVFPRDESYFGSMVLPFKFDPDAKCERWEKALLEWGDGDKEWGGLLQREYGYGLVPFRGFAKWFLHYGTSRGGKSIIEAVRKMLMGDRHYLGKSMVSMTRNFGMHKMAHTRVLCVNEVRELEKWDTEQVTALWKCVIGQDPQDFDIKHKEGLENVVSPAMVVMLSNKVPVICDENRGMSSKMVMLPFFVSFEGREDTELIKKLEKELPGIAAWAVRGAVEVWREEDPSKRFPQLEAALEDIREFLGQNNEADEFLEVPFRRDPQGYVGNELVWAYFEEWQNTKRERKIWKLNRRTFGRWIEEGNSWGVRKGRKHGLSRGFYGMALRNPGVEGGLVEMHEQEGVIEEEAGPPQ